MSIASSASCRWAAFRSSTSLPTAQGKRVAIKEYLPNTLALRSEGQTAPVITDEHLPAFRYGMKCFFEEGRALAGLSHPNVIRVLNFFRANDTVYMVMEYEQRPYAAGADPEEPRRGHRELHSQCVHQDAQRPA
jgi:serine/threonine protein kinase